MSGVYRLARGPADPFSPPDWDRAQDDGTFGNQFDDPSGEDEVPPDRRFRMIYCATQRVATFGETMARFRPSISLLTQLGAIIDDEPLEQALAGVIDPEDLHRGLVPADWRQRRRVSHTVLDSTLRFVDLPAIDTMQHLRPVLAAVAERLGVPDIDLSSIAGPQRRLTQEIARYVYDQQDDKGQWRYAGIRYLSRLKAEWECWAVFDDRMSHLRGWPGIPISVLADDDDLIQVARRFDLTIEVVSGSPHYLRP